MRRVLLGAMLLLFASVLLRTAWLSDDALITFRTIKNFVAGDGLRWNLDERVQAYTHPLWMLLLAAAHRVTRDLYYTSLAISFIATLAAVAVLIRRAIPPPAASPAAAFVLVALLSVSRSFVDYSSSGLENPLTHLLLALLLGQFATTAEWNPRAVFRLSLWASLAALNRIDTVLLTAPFLAYALWCTRRWSSVWAVCAGFAPLVAWELFSIVYYGFPFPNTAYAKVGAGIPQADLWQHGMHYLDASGLFDPLAAVVLIGGVVSPLVARSWKLLPHAVGIVGYLIYTARIGGDFMAGRFLVAPFLIASVATVWAWPVRTLLVPVAVLLISAFSFGSRSPLLAGPNYGGLSMDPFGVADERAFYFPVTGALRADQALELPVKITDPFVAADAVVVGTSIGSFGFRAPRDAIIIDQYALTDAFLARLPTHDWVHWRPGHLDRAIPLGYLESRREGRNLVETPELARLYDEIRLVTSAPIWSGARWRAIWRFNTGQVPLPRPSPEHTHRDFLQVVEQPLFEQKKP